MWPKHLSLGPVFNFSLTTHSSLSPLPNRIGCVDSQRMQGFFQLSAPNSTKGLKTHQAFFLPPSPHYWGRQALRLTLSRWSLWWGGKNCFTAAVALPWRILPHQTQAQTIPFSCESCPHISLSHSVYKPRWIPPCGSRHSRPQWYLLQGLNI